MLARQNLPNVIGTTGLGCLSLNLYGLDQQLLVVGWIKRIWGVKLGDVQDQIASMNTVIEPWFFGEVEFLQEKPL